LITNYYLSCATVVYFNLYLPTLLISTQNHLGLQPPVLEKIVRDVNLKTFGIYAGKLIKILDL